MIDSETLMGQLRDLLGPLGWSEDPAVLESHLVEERGLYHGACLGLARPADTDQVAAVVYTCAAAGVPVVPQGGNTGLVGGAVPHGGVILSTARLNKVRDVDPVNHTLTVEAGVILADVQKAAEDAGHLFPLSLAAEGSCHIGGNLATNAGGTAVLRYGNARDLVLGLEVVLPDGRVWDGLRTLRKDNTGYDLKSLFVGAEGTLGVITAAVLKMFPAPKTTATALVAVDGPAAALDLFTRAHGAAGDLLTAFEMLARFGLELACRHVHGVRDPFDAPHPCYALVELTSPRAGDDLATALETILGDAFEAGEVRDAVIAASETQSAELWRIRECLPEAQKHEGGSIKHDVSVPVARVPDFLAKAEALVRAELPGVRPCPFGHMGDGNIHFNLTQPEGADTASFLAQWTRINGLVHDLVAEFGGSFSAEHGVGQLKVHELERYRSDVELDLMRRIKKAFDPAGLMNPGKILAAD
ncbi:MAG: FAD-binding oxidoreductase [Rhodobacterales bacterium]|nr:FAD-binding oxidoreductase [Rhodobacterales bacterium]